MSIPLQNGFQNQTLERVLEDILVRFVINAPPVDLSDNARVFFLFEEAHWFYLDYVRSINPYLPNLKMKAFSKKLIELFPLIWNGGDPDEGLKEFGNYKQSIPVRGAALFNESLSKILLVQGVESPNWSFPRGKISIDEDDVTCAIREVKEETGFDITSYINKDDYIERTIRAKNYKIYLVKNIPEDAEFKPIVKNEIKEIGWKDFKRVSKKSKTNPNKYFLVSSMIKAISNWIKKNKGEVNENQIKKEVEAQLKYLLGIGQQEAKPAIDPGRELLEFIRNSTAKKQQKDALEQQQSATPPVSNLQQFQQQQQQFAYQQQAQNPVPNFGFQPPSFQQLPFISPFAPPPPFINGVPNFPYPQMFAPYPIPQQHFMHHQPFPPPPHQQQQEPFPERAPNPEQLSTPSQGLRQRNEQESKELLSILNGKSQTKKSNNSRDLLDLFNKNKNDTGDSTRKVTLLKREDAQKNDGGKDYSKNLLALLNKKPEKKEEIIEPKVEAKEEKPKLRMLKRDEPITEHTPKPVSESKKPRQESYGEDRYESPPPSKELLELIKQSKQDDDDDIEIFEDYTDDEDYDQGDDDQEQLYSDSIASVKDQNEVDQDIQPEEFNDIDPEYESDQDIINEQVPEVEQEQYPQAFEEKPNPKPKSKSKSKPKQQKQVPVAPTAVAPPKKFKLLKRGEDLEAPKQSEEQQSTPEPESTVEEQNDADVIDDAASGTSTIQFSDDDDEEEDETKYDESQITEEPEDVEKFRDEEDKTPKLVDSQASHNLLNLLHKSIQQQEEDPITENQESEQPISQTSSSNGDHSFYSADSSNGKGSNELLNLLHGGKPSSPKESEYATPVNDLPSSFTKAIDPIAQPAEEKKTPSNTLLHLLRNPKLKDIEPVEQSEPTPSISQNSGGADLLNILHKNKSPEPIQEPQLQKPSSSNSGNAGADLLSLLHKKKSPEPQQSQPVFQHDRSTTGSPANDLLDMLHQNKKPESESNNQTNVNNNDDANDNNDSAKSNNSFFEFLMKK